MQLLCLLEDAALALALVGSTWQAKHKYRNYPAVAVVVMDDGGHVMMAAPTTDDEALGLSVKDDDLNRPELLPPE